ncbi:MAG: InlB B-repeat-containing protein [Paludibacteraceae bacterium]|nr:InlB B-repeat-containing protein [Paludibacteraceae bacterium]
MVQISGSIYGYDIGTNTSCIFRYNNASSQTSDLTVPNDSKNYIASYNGSTWSTLSTFAGDQVLYLLVNSDWKSNSAWFTACFLGVTGQTWVKCTRVGTSDYYSVTVPSGEWPYVIFCRMNSSDTSTKAWSNVWNQTSDLAPSSGNNGVEITGWDNSSSWITVRTGISVSRTPTEAANAPTITNSQTVVKSGSSVTVNAQTANTGYHWVNWTTSKGSFGTATNKSTTFTPTANSAVATANYAINTQTVRFYGKGNTGGSMSNQVYTYGVAQALTSNAFTKTGYNFGGWATSSAGADAKTVVHTDGASITLNPATHGTYYDLYAIWNAKQCTINFDFDESDTGYGSNTGATTSTTATYAAAMTSVTPPTAAESYAFMGFYDAADGAGTQYYDGTGVSVTNWDKDTESPTTLYAYYKKAAITALTLVDAIVAQSVPNGVKVTPTVEPTPTGTTHIDWRVLYSNGNPLASQPSMSVYNTTGVQFTSLETSGTYLIEAVLRTGSTAKAGTTIDSTTASFQVAGTHTVTIRYQDASGNTIQASGSVTGRPLAWSDDITAPDIFGYTFARWDAGDGVTIKNGDSDPVTTSTNATIQIKAVYDGRLTAVYNKKSMIYFKNTLGWTDVYFHNSYWDNGQGGAGNKGQTRNQPMSLVPGETDIYYWEGTPGTDVAFTNATYGSGTSGDGGYQAFWAGGDGAAVVFPSNPACASSANTYYGYNAGTPMFVPITQEGQDFNKGGEGKAVYYNKGYWRYYDPVNGEEGATGYTLKIYNQTAADGRVELSSTTFTNADVTGQLFKATVNLEAAGGYGVKILRNNSMLYTNASGHLHRTGDVVVTDRQDDNYAAIWIKATAAGDYDFIITCNGDGKICLQATFPAKTGDYRVLYTDNASWSQTSNHVAQTWFHPSRVISAEGGAEDIISFYVAKDNSPQYKIEKVNSINESTGAITWTQVQGWTDISVAATGVYNFKITQNTAGDGISSVENLGEYTGNYYIRTDCAGSTKWDNYKSDDHMMTYSEYSKDHSDYTHYYMKFVESGMNVKFCIANDYSDCISDTLITHNYRGGDASHVHETDGVGYKKGDIMADANVRFMWDIRYNKLIRAYLARGKNNGSKFLVLCGQASELLAPDGSPLTGDSEANPGNNHGGGANNMQFVDNENWIYEANVKIVPNSYVKLTALFHGSTFYFKGSEGAFDADHAIQLMTGGGSAELVRVIYDFKTDRLLAAWQPSGNISTVKEINADVMFVREHQGDITQLTFSKGEGDVMGAITKIETAYAVLRFNKWTINNKSKADGHAPLSPLLSRYERDLFYISFPFRVSMNEVFGFGTYGKHWIIEEYDGATRAEKGYWAESGPNWKFIWDRKGKFFEPNQGYIIALELDEMGEESDVWANDVQNVELYFPSYGTMGDITNASVNCTIPEHLCTINRSEEIGGSGLPLGSEYDRRVKDSHWNVISVPTYVNTNNLTFANTDWITTADETHVGPNFFYEWNSADNSVTPRSGVGYTYKAMHAYLVQYCGVITWTTSVTPAAAPRRNPKYRGNYEFRLEILQKDEAVDQTFVKLSDNEAVTTEFEFNYDMIKEFNKNRSNIYTLIGTEPAAGNVLPLTDQTTVVPVGVIAKTDGDYTFSIPEGTEGIGVTLIDNETGIRTSLSAVDYTINLSAGTYDDRFLLEISPIKHVATGIETVNEEGVATNGARKIMIDGLLYIVKDGKVFDAQGRQVK